MRLFMKNSILYLQKISLLSILFCSSFIAPTFAERREKQQSQLSAQEAEQLNQLYATWKSELDLLLSGLQTAAQLITTHKMRTLEPDHAMYWISGMVRLIGKTATLPYAPLTTHKLVKLFTFNKVLINALSNAFDNDLNIIPDIRQLEEAFTELEKALHAATRTSVPLSAAAHYAAETHSAAEKLAYRMSKSGLTWYNRMYRNLITFDKNYHISSLIQTAAVTSLLASAALMVLPKGPNGEPFFNADSFLGSIEKSLYKNIIERARNYTDFQKPEYHQLALLTMIANGIGNLHHIGFFSKIGQMWSNLDAHMKGSTPEINRHMIQYMEDLTLDDPMFDCVRHLFRPFNDILRFLEDPDLYTRSGMRVPKCVLLVGAPGSGKSHAAKALAGSINQLLAQQGLYHKKAGFIEVEAVDIGRMEEIIAQAKANAPCVIIIDEFHLFGGGAQINSNAFGLSKLLMELDKIENTNDPMQQIFVVAATNRPNLLATPLLRHGRFGADARIEFPTPDFDQRRSVFKALCKRSAVDTANIDFEYLAHLTQGVSFSSIAKVFEHAGFLAKQQAQGITFNHLYQSINDVLRNLNKRVALSDNEKEVIAIHLAGIALVHLLLDTPAILDSVTLYRKALKINEQLDFLAKMDNQDEDQLYTTMHHGSFYTFNKHEHIMQELSDPYISCKTILAGIIAQRVMIGKKSSYGKDDRQLAYETAGTLLLDGLKLDKLSEQEQNRIKDDALVIVRRCEAELTTFFENHRTELRIIADALKEKNFLTAQEIKTLLATHESHNDGKEQSTMHEIQLPA
jgi:ATP-dependent Zn protease